MKVKKFLVLSIFTFIVATFFTGCSYNITEEVKQIQSIAENVIAEEDYEVPRGYLKNEFIDLRIQEKLICIDNAEKGLEITFRTSGLYPRIYEIYFVKNSNNIYKVQMNEFEDIAYDVLNGIEIETLKNYSAIVSEQKLKISQKQYNGTTITVTFDISGDTLEIIDIELDIEFCIY